MTRITNNEIEKCRLNFLKPFNLTSPLNNKFEASRSLVVLVSEDRLFQNIRAKNVKRETLTLESAVDLGSHAAIIPFSRHARLAAAT